MPDLTPRHEAFCQSYALAANGAAAARLAGYAAASAPQAAHVLLQRADIAARLAELNAEIVAERARATDDLMAKLEPVYRAGLAAGDHDTVLQAVELQARIAGLVHGAATVRPRALKAAQPAAGGHEAALAELAGLDGDDPAADADFGPEDGR